MGGHHSSQVLLRSASLSLISGSGARTLSISPDLTIVLFDPLGFSQGWARRCWSFVFTNSHYLSPMRTSEYMINFDLILILLWGLVEQYVSVSENNQFNLTFC